MLNRSLVGLAIALLGFSGAFTTTRYLMAAAAPDAPKIDKCVKRATRIIYVNGIDNPTFTQAVASARRLQMHLKEAGITEPVQPFWNPGEGMTTDLMESAALQSWGASTMAVLDAMASANFVGMAPVWTGQPGSAELAQSTIRPFIDELKAQIREALSNNEAVVIVAHSQGNLLANTALREMGAAGVVGMEMVGVVGLATPDTAPPPGEFQQVTSSEDPIRRVPGALPANFIVPPKADADPSRVRQVLSNDLNAWDAAADAVKETVKQHLFDESYLSNDIRNDNGVGLRDAVIGSVATVKARVERARCAMPGDPNAATQGEAVLP